MGHLYSGTALEKTSEHAAALAILCADDSRISVRDLLRVHGTPMAALMALQPLGGHERIDALLERLESERAVLFAVDEPGFPARLRCIPDAPLVIYVRGRPCVLERPAIAIVGARRASRHGLEIAADLARTLAGCGALIVSGLAIGIDGAAHRAALDQPGGTAAVLGSGLARVQPSVHARLARQVVEAGGVLVSEYPLDTRAAPFRFPERNRVISGLSLGVVVVEASARSGSLITARLALEQGRDVMAVPGSPRLPNSAGGNRLIKQGSPLTESAQDVLDALGLVTMELPASLPEALQPIHPAAALARRVLPLLDTEPLSVEEIAARLSESVRACAVALTDLELQGFVGRYRDGYIRRPY